MDAENSAFVTEINYVLYTKKQLFKIVITLHNIIVLLLVSIKETLKKH